MRGQTFRKSTTRGNGETTTRPAVQAIRQEAAEMPAANGLSLSNVTITWDHRGRDYEITGRDLAPFLLLLSDETPIGNWPYLIDVEYNAMLLRGLSGLLRGRDLENDPVDDDESYALRELTRRLIARLEVGGSFREDESVSFQVHIVTGQGAKQAARRNP